MHWQKLKGRKWKDDEINDDISTKGDNEDCNKKANGSEMGLVTLASKAICPYVVSILEQYQADEYDAKKNGQGRRSIYKASHVLG